MTANELFTQIKDRGQKHLSFKQTAWLRSMVTTEFPGAEDHSSPYKFYWDGPNGITRILYVTPAIGTGRIEEVNLNAPVAGVQ